MPEQRALSPEEIGEIYHRHMKTVYRVCFVYLKNPADAEDAVQSTFIKLMEHTKPFQNTEHEKAWLIVTAANHCKDLLRHWWRKTAPIDEAVSAPAFFKPDETLQKVLDLPEKIKIAIYLYYYEGYSTVEIARMMKKNQSTVRGYLRTGRELLKLTLGGEDK